MRARGRGPSAVLWWAALLVFWWTASPATGAPAATGGTAAGVPSEALYGVKCAGGHAGPFPCRRVDLAAFLPLADIGGSSTSDVWGWADPETGREYALVGKTNGTAFVDVTKPSRPVYLGDLPETRDAFIWQDIEVYRDHAFIVSDVTPYGIRIFDLTRLRGATGEQVWTPDLIYPLPPSAHTITIDTDSGYAYVNGFGLSSPLGDPIILDIRDPEHPELAGVIYQDGYTHDSQCVLYRGPDRRFRDHEVCIESNEDTITIVDVTDKMAPVQVARFDYPGAAYVHQGWLTEDQSYWLEDDEEDELLADVHTTTYIFDVRRLDDPHLIGVHNAKTTAIDHNQYIKGSFAYQGNYTAGLRILDVSRAARGVLTEVAFFDVVPDSDRAEFDGTWGSYPFLPSGTLLAGGMGQGLFVLTPHLPPAR